MENVGNIMETSPWVPSEKFPGNVEWLLFAKLLNDTLTLNLDFCHLNINSNEFEAGSPADVTLFRLKLFNMCLTYYHIVPKLALYVYAKTWVQNRIFSSQSTLTYFRTTRIRCVNLGRFRKRVTSQNFTDIRSEDMSNTG